MKETNSRRIAAFIVAKWLATKDFPQTMLPKGSDRAFVQDLVYTVIRRLRILRKVLGGMLKRWPAGEMEALLYVGAAQILFMDDVKDYAAVNETVEAAKLSGNRSVPSLVNGVLRNLIRRRDEIVSMIAKSPLEERESFPSVLVRRWRARFGEQNTERLCELYNQPAETYLARQDGSFVVLERGNKVEEVDGYDEGGFIVQDPGTRLAVELMSVKAGERILDACAAPGGKTVQLAWRGAQVTACEVNPKRRERLIENLTRLKLSVEVVAELPLDSSFQKVLVDAPCSNTGVMRRRPDARWNWSEEKLAQLTKLQGEILNNAAGRVEKGGSLVYSTCSIEPEENEEQVAAFLKSHPDFVLCEQKTLLPFETGHDGAFAALMTRKI